MRFSNKQEKIQPSNNKNNERKNSSFSEFLFNWIKYNVKDIWNSKDVAKELWLEIRNNVPIYYIEGIWWPRKWSYDSKKNIIFIFDNADSETLKHEIIHSVEFNKPVSNELYNIYELAKNIISEKSFDGNAVSFNFKKNIHEFIADWYSKWLFINALKKEWIYGDFLKKTKYIFE